jgi:hypothetical protein
MMMKLIFGYSCVGAEVIRFTIYFSLFLGNIFSSFFSFLGKLLSINSDYFLVGGFEVNSGAVESRGVSLINLSSFINNL